MSKTSNVTRPRLVAFLTLGLVMTGLSVGTTTNAAICPPVLGGGSTDCGLGSAYACAALDQHDLAIFESQREDACGFYNIQCPGGTYWIVNAGYSSAGPRDYVLGSMDCAGETIAACVADFLRNPCEATGDSIEGPGECRLQVFDQADGFAVVEAYASCQDPIDPTRTVPAVVEYVYEETPIRGP